jgi:hypothetical protein
LTCGKRPSPPCSRSRSRARRTSESRTSSKEAGRSRNASGSEGNDNTHGIGNRPIDFNAWDKFQLGWPNYEVAWPFAKKADVKLGPDWTERVPC